MNKYTLIAGGNELDTNDDLDISINYQIADILDISKRNTSYTKTLIIPGTGVNNRFFKQIFDVNIDNVSFNPNVSIISSVRIGDNEVMKGSLQLTKIVIDGKSVDYEVVIIGQLKNIIDNLGDNNLRALNLSKYNHIRNRDNIQKSWDFNVREHGQDTLSSGPGNGYVYPYIINGNSTDIDKFTYIYDLFPAPYLKTVMDSLFEFGKFTYTSKFFNSEYFKMLILPYAGTTIEMPPEVINERTAVIGLNEDFLDITYRIGEGGLYQNKDCGYCFLDGIRRESGIVDDGGTPVKFRDDDGQWDGHKFTANETGYYNLRFVGKMIPAVSRVDGGTTAQFKSGQFIYNQFMYLIKLDGTKVLLDSTIDGNNGINGALYFSPNTNEYNLNQGISADSHYYTDSILSFSRSADNVPIQAGEQVVIEFGLQYNKDVKWKGSSDKKHRMRLVLLKSKDGSFTKFEATSSSNSSLGNEMVNMSSMLPDMKMKDLLFDVVNMFNLIVVDNPDVPNDLIIEPADDFYKSKQKVVDWTYKKDNDSPVSIKLMSELDANAYKFKYKEDSDFYNEKYQEETKREYGEYIKFVQNDFSETTKTTELSFAPTVNASKYINGRIAPFFTDISDDELTPKNVKQRILFYNGTLPCSSYQLKTNIGQANGTTLTRYPYCGMWDDPQRARYSLEFSNSSKHYYNFTKVPNNTLYNQFHRSTLLNIANPNSRLLEASFKLTPKDIATFDFRNIIFLDGSYWRVNSIKDYNPVGSDSLTKVVLFKLNDVTINNPFSIDVAISNNSCPSDVYIDLNATPKRYKTYSGQSITADCCNQLGGSFINGICRVNYLSEDYTEGYVRTPASTSIVPTSNPNGPLVFEKNLNSIASLGVKVIGSGNYVPSGISRGLIIGDNVSVSNISKSVLAIGDNIEVKDDIAIKVGDIDINQKGQISVNDLNISTSIPVTQAELLIMKNNGDMFPNALYHITDRDIYLRSINENRLELRGTHLMKVPKRNYYTPQTFSPGTVTYVLEGIYGQTTAKGSVPNSTLSTVRMAIWGGQIWVRDTVGADVPGSLFDSISGGWSTLENTEFEELIELDINQFTDTMIFSVLYNLDNNTILEQSDLRGNIIYTQTNDSYIRATDWNAPGINNNKCVGIINNYNSGIISNNECTLISENTSDGDISQNRITGSILGNSNQGKIYNNTITGDILFNSTLDDIESNRNNGNIEYNSITGVISFNTNNGVISGNTGAVSITDAVVDK